MFFFVLEPGKKAVKIISKGKKYKTFCMYQIGSERKTEIFQVIQRI